MSRMVEYDDETMDILHNVDLSQQTLKAVQNNAKATMEGAMQAFFDHEGLIPGEPVKLWVEMGYHHMITWEFEKVGQRKHPWQQPMIVFGYKINKGNGEKDTSVRYRSMEFHEFIRYYYLAKDKLNGSGSWSHTKQT